MHSWFCVFPTNILVSFISECGAFFVLHILFWDKTEAILHSARRIYNLCRFTYPLRRILKIFKQNSRRLEILHKNNRAGIVQYDMVKSGLKELIYSVLSIKTLMVSGFRNHATVMSAYLGTVTPKQSKQF